MKRLRSGFLLIELMIALAIVMISSGIIGCLIAHVSRLHMQAIFYLNAATATQSMLAQSTSQAPMYKSTASITQTRKKDASLPFETVYMAIKDTAHNKSITIQKGIYVPPTH